MQVVDDNKVSTVPVMLPLIEAANTPPPAVVAKFIALASPFSTLSGKISDTILLT